MSTTPLSVVIVAKNEQERIEECIRSALNWADEIIVVDDESNDNTCDIAKKLGAKIFIRKMDIEGKHRNWAYSQATCDWVFSLDADERFTEELKQEISEVIKNNPTDNAFTVPRRNFIGNYWIRWGGLYPSAQIKLFRKKFFYWEEVEVHPRARLEGSCAKLTNDLIHYTYRNWHDFLKKLNNQTTLEARKWYNYSFQDPKKVEYKMNFIHALWRTLDRFFRTFIGKKGYRDGFIGFMIAYHSSVYQMVSYAKFREFKFKKTR